MIRVGIAGLGFMGMIHYLAYQKTRGAKVVAMCEQDAKRLAGDWREIKGNFGPQGEMMDLSGIAKYADLKQMLADPDVDMVDICLPPALHAEVAVASLEAGKHVLSEKPMAMTTAECEKMVTAAEAAGRQLYVGHVLALFPEYAQARKLIDSGKYGKLLGGSFLRVVSDPLWLDHFWDANQCGGPMLDLHVHDAHFIRLLFGMPVGVSSLGRMRGDLVEYFNTQFRFADPSLVVTATSGVINQQGRSFTHGFEIHLEGATLHYEMAVIQDDPKIMPLTLLDSEGKATQPELGDGDPVLAFEAEMEEVVACLGRNEASSVLSGDLARDAIILCHKQTESVKKGRAVEV